MCKPMPPLCPDFEALHVNFVQNHSLPNNYGVDPPTERKIFHESCILPHSAAPAHLSTDQYPQHSDIVSAPYFYTSGHAPGVVGIQPADPHRLDTVSPSQTFGSPSLPDSNGTHSADGAASPVTLSNPVSCPNSTSQEKHRDPLATDVHPETTAEPPRRTGRRRTSEYVEPGSARAIYLEKNRKAASKCRNKQRKQQEQLVENARIAERQHRILKAEVQMLENELRQVMSEATRHADCSDKRLYTYIQRKADRLAAGIAKSPSAGPPSFERSTSGVPQ